MAQTYEIDINRYNGTDYDTLLPTPATHAATHKADGTDPLVCQTGNYGDKTVSKAKLIAGATYTPSTIILAVASWSNNQQVINVSGVAVNNAVIVAPAPDSFKDYGENGVYCSAQAAGTLTFTCDSVPTTDITVNVIIPT